MVKYLLSGLLSGVAFLLIYLLGKNFIIALIIGLLLGILALFLIPDDSKKKVDGAAKRKTYGQLIPEGKQYVRNIKEHLPKLENDPLQKPLEKLTLCARQILDSVDENPSNYKTLSDLVEIYLPAIDTIITRYMDVTHHGLTGKEAQQYQKDVLGFLAELNTSFTGILNHVHTDEIENASAEMSALRILLSSDGYQGISDFQIEQTTIKEEETHE